MISESAGRRDDDVRLFVEKLRLLQHLHSSNYFDNLDASGSTEDAKLIGDLLGQFPRRRQHNSKDAVRILKQELQRQTSENEGGKLK